MNDNLTQFGAIPSELDNHRNINEIDVYKIHFTNLITTNERLIPFNMTNMVVTRTSPNDHTQLHANVTTRQLARRRQRQRRAQRRRQMREEERQRRTQQSERHRLRRYQHQEQRQRLLQDEQQERRQTPLQRIETSRPRPTYKSYQDIQWERGFLEYLGYPEHMDAIEPDNLLEIFGWEALSPMELWEQEIIQEFESLAVYEQLRLIEHETEQEETNQ